jgi:hypothetical protein
MNSTDREPVRSTRRSKAEVLAALLPEAIEARRWHERFTALTFVWGAGKRGWEAAKTPRRRMAQKTWSTLARLAMRRI